MKLTFRGGGSVAGFAPHFDDRDEELRGMPGGGLVVDFDAEAFAALDDVDELVGADGAP